MHFYSSKLMNENAYEAEEGTTYGRSFWEDGRSPFDGCPRGRNGWAGRTEAGTTRLIRCSLMRPRLATLSIQAECLPVSPHPQVFHGFPCETLCCRFPSFDAGSICLLATHGN